MSEYLVQGMKVRGDKFHLILEPELVNVSFWYVPTRLRGVPHDADRIRELGEVSCLIY